MKKILLWILLITLTVTLSLSFFGCSKATEAEKTIADWQKTYTKGDFGIRNKSNPFVEFTFSTGDTLRVELYPDVAPISVENFLRYVEDGFYEGVVVHRIIDAAVQMGGYEVKDNALVQKEATYPEIKGEFTSNGVKNNVRHRKGIISMARTSLPNSATSQFFLCRKTYPSWDGEYAAFGCVIDEESMATIRKIGDTSDKYTGTNGTLPDTLPDGIISITKATVVWAK